MRINFGSFEKRTLTRTVLQEEAANVTPLTPSEFSVKIMAERLSHASRLTKALNRLDVTLFDSGPDMPLYAEKGSPLLERLRQVQTVDNITEIQTIKNKLLNGTHAIIAWYSSLLGYQAIGQGMGDERVVTLAKRLINQEIKPAILRENPALSDYLSASFVNGFIKRCKASFKDPCHRIGRDPMRKLQRRERILGSIDLANKHGFATPMLEFGTALGILYAVRLVRPEDKECQLIKRLYEGGQSVEAVLTYTGDYNGRPNAGLVRLPMQHSLPVSVPILTSCRMQNQHIGNGR